jgi:AraC-like DNA-binding protein
LITLLEILVITNSSSSQDPDIRLISDLRSFSGKFQVHFDIEVNYLFEGSARYFFGRTDWNLPERRLIAFWGTTPHRLVDVSPNARLATLRIPLVDYLKWESPKPIFEGVFEGGVIIEPVELTAPQRMDRWLLEYASEDPNLRLAALLEMQAAMLRSQVAVPARKSSSNANAEAQPVMVMCRHINANLRESLTSSDVADVAGLHPNYAMRLFKRLTGMTIQEYVVHGRMAHAQRLLIRSNESVEQIGDKAGFQCASQYYATFKKVTGYTPLQFRKRHLD